MKMKPTEWLAEELDINGVLRYESGATLTQKQGPKRARGELFNDLEAAVAHRDRIQAAIDSMETFLEKEVDKQGDFFYNN